MFVAAVKCPTDNIVSTDETITASTHNTIADIPNTDVNIMTAIVSSTVVTSVVITTTYDFVGGEFTSYIEFSLSVVLSYRSYKYTHCGSITFTSSTTYKFWYLILIFYKFSDN